VKSAKSAAPRKGVLKREKKNPLEKVGGSDGRLQLKSRDSRIYSERGGKKELSYYPTLEGEEKSGGKNAQRLEQETSTKRQ